MKHRLSYLSCALLTLCFASTVCIPASATTAKAGPKIPEIVSNVDSSGGSPSAEQLKTLQEISDKAAKTGTDYYAKIVDLIGAKKHPLPDKITLTFTYGYDGVAATGGNHTDINNGYALAHPDDIPGVIVHELTHVAQAYSKDTGYDTGWLTEGIADYVRWFNFEPISKRPHFKQSQHPKATGAYKLTASFLFWAEHKYNKHLVKTLNESLYDGSYKPELWVTLTGKSLEDLGTEWVSTLEP